MCQLLFELCNFYIGMLKTKSIFSTYILIFVKGKFSDVIQLLPFVTHKKSDSQDAATQNKCGFCEFTQLFDKSDCTDKKSNNK